MATNSSPVSVAVVGAGNRGRTYARLARALPDVRIVAVAEPVDERRERLADEVDVPAAGRFPSWEALADAGPEADLVVVATQDALHREPATTFLARGHHVLLEKPMAPTEDDAAAIVDAAEAADRQLVVAHVLRYQPYSKLLMSLIADGAIGDVVTVDHLEPVGDQHFAHSYVRGNWRREDLSSSALMSKSCHDIDWMAAVVGTPARRVGSFGSLFHFRADRAPAGSTDRCVTCPVEPTCAWSAVRFYTAAMADPDGWRWPLSIVTDDHTPEGVAEALRTGPYGRCVYRSDNDVVDHQVVIVEFDGGRTATFTMSAFTEMGRRRSRIGGTAGHLEGDGRRVVHYDFLSGTTRTHDVAGDAADASAARGHGGGDRGLITDLVSALRSGDWSGIPTDARESLETHRIVWAAERARRTGTVVQL